MNNKKHAGSFAVLILFLCTSSFAIAQDFDGNLVAAAGVSEPVDLPLSTDTVGEAVDLFDFTIVDGGTADTLPMTVSQVVLNVSGTASDSDRNKVTWRLNGPDANNVTGTYNASGNTITFAGLSISVADGNSETYTVNGYYNDNTGLTPGQTMILSVDGDTDLTVGVGTQMGATSAVNNGVGTSVVDDIAPVVTSVSVPINTTYAIGAILDFTVNFNENITVDVGSGTPRLSLTVGSATRFADYLSGTGTSALVFREVVQSGDEDLDGITLDGQIDPNLGTLRGSAGNDAVNTLNSVGSLTSVLVDALAPVIAEVTPVTSLGNDSTPNVTFSTTESGTLSVGGSCGSQNEGAVAAGSNTITLTQPDNSTSLATGTYTNCTLTVTDSAGNASNNLTLSTFSIDSSSPVLDTNAGATLDEGDTGVAISNSELAASDNFSGPSGVTFELAAAPANGTLRNNGSALAGGGTFTQSDINNDLVTYDHDSSETTSDSFTFEIRDETGNVADNGLANYTFSFTVNPVNDPPVTTADSATTNEDNAVFVDVLSNDSDSDGSLVASSVVVVTVPANGSTSVNSGTGVITYTPDADFEGADSFEYTVEDDGGEPSAATLVSITVVAQNDPPVAVADSGTTSPGTALSVDVAANDLEVDQGDAPDPKTIVVVSAPSNGSAVVNGATNLVDYLPIDGFIGSDSFTYSIDDASGATSNIATVTITVSAGPSITSSNSTTSIPTMGFWGYLAMVLGLLTFGMIAVRGRI